MRIQLPTPIIISLGFWVFKIILDIAVQATASALDAPPGSRLYDRVIGSTLKAEAIGLS